MVGRLLQIKTYANRVFTCCHENIIVWNLLVHKLTRIKIKIKNIIRNWKKNHPDSQVTRKISSACCRWWINTLLQTFSFLYCFKSKWGTKLCFSGIILMGMGDGSFFVGFVWLKGTSFLLFLKLKWLMGFVLKGLTEKYFGHGLFFIF